MQGILDAIHIVVREAFPWPGSPRPPV
jgi:hypothetical protein